MKADESSIFCIYLKSEHNIGIVKYFKSYYRSEDMGIQGLSKVIGDYAPSAVKENEIKNYFGMFIMFIVGR